MKNYESVIIIKPTLNDKEIEKLKEKVTKLINQIGQLKSIESLGLKRLAYEIKKCNEGYYCLFNFEATPNSIYELERNYRITDDILKFIVVRKD